VPLDLLDAAARKGYVAPLEPYLARQLHVDSLSEIEVPSVWKLDRDDGSSVLGIFNWTDQSLTRSLSRTQLGLSDQAYRSHDIWSASDADLPGVLALTQPPHSVTLLAITPP